MLLFLFKGLISKLVSPYLTLCMQCIVLENMSTLQWKVFWIDPPHVPSDSKNTDLPKHRISSDPSLPKRNGDGVILSRGGQNHSATFN